MPPFRTLRRSARLKSRQRGEEFAYRPLGDHEIRLVVLLPGSFSLQIECNLLHHKFDETLQYDALSYTWGDPTITDVILLDGHEFRITRGLECALRYIRLPQDRRVLWIDAICINQRDHSERSHQVQMMFDIYQNSEAVRSWIGCETEADDYCVRNKLDRLKSSYHAQSGLSIDQKSSNGSSEDWNVSKLLEVFGKPSSLEQKETLSTNSHTHICPPIVETFRSRSGLNAWCDMGVLVSRPYWTRVWIQQEISRESKVIVHFGKSSFPLTSIYNHCQSLRHFNHACSHHRADIKAAYESMRYIQRLYSYVFFLSQDFTRGPTGETKDSISALLRSQFLRRTTDPRDKIYALVGLIPHWRDGSLPVDYRLPVRYIYAAAVKVMAERYNTLDTLVTLFAIPKRISLAELPSWCPDWSKVIHFNGGITMANDIFVEDLPMFMSNDMGDASRDGPPNISFASDNQILITSGLRLDTVKYVANCFGNRFPFIEGKSWEMVQHAAGLARLFSGGPYWSYWRSHGDLMPPDNEKHMIAVKMEEAKDSFDLSNDQVEAQWKDQAEAFWRTLFMHCAEPDETEYEMFRPRDAAETEQYTTSQEKRDFSSGLNADMDLSFPYKNNRHLKLQECRLRRFFISHNMYMGLAPDDARYGDLICILFGCSLPVVLRQVGDHYIFIGAAYFHGWMKGEAVKLYQEGKLPLQDFNIH